MVRCFSFTVLPVPSASDALTLTWYRLGNVPRSFACYFILTSTPLFISQQFSNSSSSKLHRSCHTRPTLDSIPHPTDLRCHRLTPRLAQNDSSSRGTTPCPFPSHKQELTPTQAADGSRGLRWTIFQCELRRGNRYDQLALPGLGSPGH